MWIHWISLNLSDDFKTHLFPQDLQVESNLRLSHHLKSYLINWETKDLYIDKECQAELIYSSWYPVQKSQGVLCGCPLKMQFYFDSHQVLKAKGETNESFQRFNFH